MGLLLSFVSNVALEGGQMTTMKLQSTMKSKKQRLSQPSGNAKSTCSTPRLCAIHCSSKSYFGTFYRGTARSVINQISRSKAENAGMEGSFSLKSGLLSGFFPRN